MAAQTSERRAFSVSIFARHDGEVLLVRHRRLGQWLPVGGEIEAGETPLEAATRELREETGLSGAFTPLPGVAGTPAGLMAYEEHLAGAKGRHLNFCFVADVPSREVRPNAEFGEWEWRHEAPAEAPENVRQLLALAVGDTPQRLAERWLAAFNGRDLDALLALYDAAALHHSPKLRERQPETEGRISGKNALRTWWADSFARLAGLRYDRIALTADHERALLEYWRRLPGSPDLRVAELFVCRAGKIVESLVYHG